MHRFRGGILRQVKHLFKKDENIVEILHTKYEVLDKYDLIYPKCLTLYN